MDTLVHIGLLNAVLAMGLALLAAAARVLRRRPAFVHALWLLVLLKLLTPPFLVIPISWLPRAEPESRVPEWTTQSGGIRTVDRAEPLPSPRAPTTTDRTEPQPADASENLPAPFSPPVSPNSELADPSEEFELEEEVSSVTATSSSVAWEMIVAAIWLTGSAIWWTVAGVRLFRFRILLRSASPAPVAVQQRAERLAVRLGLSRCPRVYVLAASVTPLLWAVAGTPCLLLPAALWARLTAEQQDTLLAHELAHLRRGDPWMRRLEIVVLGLYWWHPVVWWARHEIQEAEEQCCDAWVLWALPAAAEAYAAALLETVAYLSRLRPAVPLGASGAGQTYLLRRRLTMILQGTTPRALSRAAVVVLLVCGAVCLPLRPTWGQPPARTSSNEELPALVQVAPATSSAHQPGATTPPKITTGVSVTSDAGLTGSIVRPHDVEDAKDAIELLQAQLEGKKAELLESKALVEQSRRQLARQDKLRERGAISEEEVDQLRTELTVRQARLQVKEAQIKEVEVRLGQAKRWLSRLQSGAQHPAGDANSPASIGVFGESRLHSGATLAPSSGLTTGSGSKPPPHTSAAGAGTSSSRAGPLNTLGNKLEGSDTPGDSEQRIRNLEKKLDTLMEQLNELRREIRRQKPGGEGEARGVRRSQ
jgi:beta-lactamase regulating signal transducer with metallopeptidase domain